MGIHAFHVHTARCGHAENITDEQIVLQAIALGAADIWFTDHAPFPGDPFGQRMRYNDLEGYLSSLLSLQKKYRHIIDIHIGLETEYFKKYEDYYQQLLQDRRIELLLLGQHMYESESGEYSFFLPREEKEKSYLIEISDAIINGMKSGYFRICAHPDRCFMYEKSWGIKTDVISEKIIQTAYDCDVILEKNLSSVQNGKLYSPIFWKKADNIVPSVIGIDAHSSKELDNMLPQNQIKIILKRWKLSVEQLANATNIPPNVLQSWIDGVLPAKDGFIKKAFIAVDKL